MLYELPVFTDSQPQFQVDFDFDDRIYDAYACSRTVRQWVWVMSHADYDRLKAKCEDLGMSFYGADEDTLYEATFGHSIWRN